MAAPYAFVTLVTSDSYLPGALALVAALKDLHPSPPTPPEVDFQTVCLVTPETVDVTSIKLLRRAFNIVIGVEIIEQEDEKNLRLLGRPDLSTVLTKLHVFRLTQYSKIIFLDADVLPVRPLSHLFSLPHEFSAVPDVGWPDIFNSGVLVLSPGNDKFDDLMKLQKSKGSWDGGDQGLLNEWRGSDWNRLSFIYNTTPTAAYTYAPAYERFGSNIAAVHFIGTDKPWKGLLYRSPGIKSSEATLGDGTKRAYNYEALVDRWYEVYDRNYRQESTLPKDDFPIPRYASVWDDGTSFGADFPASSNMPSSGSGGALGLEELRKAAVDGLNSLSGSGSAMSFLSASSNEGEYRSMPLEGRVDLMRPQKLAPPSTEDAEESRHQGDSTDGPGTPRPTYIQMPSGDPGYFGGGTLPTPGPHLVPNAPYIHGHSLPPSETPTPYYGPPSGPGVRSSGPSNNTLQVFYQPQAQSEPGPEYQLRSHNSPWEQHQQHSSHPQQHQEPDHHQHSSSSQPQSHFQQYSHSQPQEQHTIYRDAPFTPQQRDSRYSQDSSESDSPTPPAYRIPPTRQQHQQHLHHFPQQQQHQQQPPQPQSQSQSQSHHGQPSHIQYQPRGPGEQRVQVTKQKSRRSSMSEYPVTGRGEPPVSQQRVRIDSTPARYHSPSLRGSAQNSRAGTRRASPMASGQITPTQARPGQFSRAQEVQRGHETLRPRLVSHDQHQTSSGQQHHHHAQRSHEHAHSPQSEQHHHHHPEQHSHHIHYQPPPSLPPVPEQKTPPRPGSPPKFSWNPSVEPPPKQSPLISAFPEDTYFPNVWDEDEHESFQHFSPERNQRADVFFQPPPPPIIPEHLLREGQYSNVLGPSQDTPHDSPGAVSPPAPDKTKVHAVFPWEEKPRHVPRRVFPRTGSPPPAAHYIESERTSSPVSTPPPPLPVTVAPVALHGGSQSHTPISPLALQGLPLGGSFSNAWDTVPSIQRYASKLVGSPKVYPHLFMTQPPPPDDDWRRQWREQRDRDWQEQHDASSMDGDDEDEGDSEDEQKGRDASEDEGRSGGRRRGSTSGRPKKQYRTRGVQASPDTDAKGVQCEIIKDEKSITRVSKGVGDDTEMAAESPTASAPRVGLGLRRQWQQGSPFSPGSTLLPSAVLRDFKGEPEQVVGTPIVLNTARSALPFPSMASPSGLRSPATLASPKSYSPPKVPSPLRVESPPKVPSPPRVQSPLASPSVIKAPSPIKAATPIVTSPRSGLSPRPVQSPKIVIPGRTGGTDSPRPGGANSPRPSNISRRVSTSSVPGSQSSRANSPVTSRMHPHHLSTSTPSPKHSRLSSLTSPGLQRTTSLDTYVTPSPSSTNDSIATPAETEPRTRRGSRVWDPARGVDVFKKGSEEVLARFLKMGSFDDEEKQQRQQQQQQAQMQQQQNVQGLSAA